MCFKCRFDRVRIATVHDKDQNKYSLMEKPHRWNTTRLHLLSLGGEGLRKEGAIAGGGMCEPKNISKMTSIHFLFYFCAFGAAVPVLKSAMIAPT